MAFYDELSLMRSFVVSQSHLLFNCNDGVKQIVLFKNLTFWSAWKDW